MASQQDKQNETHTGNPDKSGLFRKAFRWGLDPAAHFGTDEIKQNARYIQGMWSGVRQGPRHRKRRLTPEGNYDIVAMAFDYGVSPQRIMEMIGNSRTISARASRIYLISGTALLAYWAYRMVITPIDTRSLVYVALVLGMAIWFFVLSFAKALENWRLRKMRPGTLSEFLHTEDSWWPH